MASEENRKRIQEKMIELLPREAPENLIPFLTLFEERPNAKLWKKLELTLNHDEAFKICALNIAKKCSEVKNHTHYK